MLNTARTPSKHAILALNSPQFGILPGRALLLPNHESTAGDTPAARKFIAKLRVSSILL
jgi:hypothetical protein